VDLGTAAAPRQITILRFRGILKEHDLGGAMLVTHNRHLADKGIHITSGTIVDATIIHASSSTKNSTEERDTVRSATCEATLDAGYQGQRGGSPARIESKSDMR
jgi:IS5 family transposase